jgi:hypothetical protein
MNRSAAALLVLALAPQVSCNSKKICGPYLSMNLPGVTKVDRCDVELTSDFGIGGETTATGADFVKAIGGSGFELGRDAASTYGDADHMQYFRKDGVVFFMFTNLSKRESGATFFNIYPTPRQPTTWLPQASWEKVASIAADRQALIARLGSVADLVKSAAKAPKQCDGSLAALDPALAKSGKTVLLNLDASDFRGPKAERYSRGPEPFPVARKDGDTFNSPYSTKVSTLLEERAPLDEIAERRVMPVISITEYHAPKLDHNTDPAAIFHNFTGGDAKFDVVVVDLKERTVLCRSSASAKSSDTLDVTQYTRKNRSGEVQDVSVSSYENEDLAGNISKAAFVALGKMSPAFAR